MVQASVNSALSLLAYVVKNESLVEEATYSPYIVEIKRSEKAVAHSILKEPKTKQTFTQFLWKKDKFDRVNFYQDKFLLLVHEQSVFTYTTTIKMKRNAHGDLPTILDFSQEDTWFLDVSLLACDIIVKNFTWSQWDSINQCLYYIHLKPSARSLSLMDDSENGGLSPTLSAFQFNDTLPTETVMNIPLNLPKIPKSTNSTTQTYEDDVVPLRIHDSTLNLVIVSDQEQGMLFVCHYYLYQPNR